MTTSTTRWLAYVSAALWFVAIIVISFAYIRAPVSIRVLAKAACDVDGDGQLLCREPVNAVSAALQLGRLDLISISIIIFSAIIGLFVLFGFVAVRERSGLIAEKAAADTAKSIAESTAKEWMRQYSESRLYQDVYSAVDDLREIRKDEPSDAEAAEMWDDWSEEDEKSE